MRAYIITFSSIAFVLLIGLGPIANLLSGWQIDVPSPYNYPPRMVGTLLGLTPGLLFALTGLGYALYDAAQRHAPRWFMALLIWPVIPLLASSLMFAGALTYAGLWFVSLALLPLAPFLYGLMAATPGLRPAAPAPAPRRYPMFVGILVVVTIALGALLLAPAPESLAGPALVSPAVLQVDPLQTTADCAKGIYPQINLANIGSQTFTWTAQSEDPDVTISPASGILASNSSTYVAIEGATAAHQVNIDFTPSIGTGFTAEITCQ